MFERDKLLNVILSFKYFRINALFIHSVFNF